MDATYGSRRMCAKLNAQGFVVGRYKVRSLMQALSFRLSSLNGTVILLRKPSAVAPNALNRPFNPPMANLKWTGDITDIRTSQGWLYLADVAVQHHRPKHPVLFHSD